MKPVLLALDFKALTARRYFPKIPAGFMIDEVALCKPEDQDETMKDQVEKFRVNGIRVGRRHYATERRT